MERVDTILMRFIGQLSNEGQRSVLDYAEWIHERERMDTEAQALKRRAAFKVIEGSGR